MTATKARPCRRPPPHHHRGGDDDVKLPAGGTVKPINSTDVIVSEHLPTYPDHREDARRTVRHGQLFRQVLAKDGEQIGPAPGEPSHAFMAGDRSHDGPMTLFVSREMWADLMMHQEQRAEWQRLNEWVKARLPRVRARRDAALDRRRWAALAEARHTTTEETTHG